MTFEIPRRFTLPRAVRPFGVALAGLALLACSAASVGAQPPGGPPPGFNGAPQGGQPGGPPAAFQDELATKLAANLGLPVDTVKAALQQAQPDMPPPAFGGQGGTGGPGAPGGAPPPMPPAQGDLPAAGGPGSPPGGPGPVMPDDVVNQLAAALGLPTDTVSSALQQTFQQMQPPGRPGGF